MIPYHLLQYRQNVFKASVRIAAISRPQSESQAEEILAALGQDENNTPVHEKAAQGKNLLELLPVHDENDDDGRSPYEGLTESACESRKASAHLHRRS